MCKLNKHENDAPTGKLWATYKSHSFLKYREPTYVEEFNL